MGDDKLPKVQICSLLQPQRHQMYVGRGREKRNTEILNLQRTGET